MRRKTLVLVDLSNALKRSMFSHKGLTSGTTFTGGVYGVLVGLAKVLGAYGATSAVLCQDSKPYRRSLEYPKYKAKRVEEKDETLIQALEQSRRLIDEAAQVIGVPLWAVPGFEADDLIAHACRRESNRYDRVVIWSNDSDLFQLLVRPNIWIERAKEVMTQAKLLAAHGLTAEQHLLLSVLMGSHNDVAGIEGVGPITARKIVDNPALFRQYTDKHSEIIKRNQHLMRLPHPALPTIHLPDQTRAFVARDFYRWASRYDIAATEKMLSAFEGLTTRV